MKIKDRQQLLVVVAIGVVAFFAGDKLIFSPLWKSWKERGAKIVELRRQVTEGDRLLARAPGIRRRWNEMRSNTLPNNTTVAEQQILQTFDGWARNSGISVTAITPQWKSDADDYRSLECRVDAFGSLATVTRFLYSLEKDALALKVESVEISARDNAGQQIGLGLQLSGLVLNPQAQ